MEDILVPLAGMATAVILLFPLVRAGVNFIERKTRGGGDSDKLGALREDLEVLQDRLEMLERSEDRIADIEERLDFAERLLAQGRAAPQIEDHE